MGEATLEQTRIVRGTVSAIPAAIGLMLVFLAVFAAIFGYFLVIGIRQTEERMVERANAAFGLTLKMDLDNNASNLLRRSDQWPFLQRGVPAIWFHTGLHPDYHTTFDRPEKIEYDKMERIVRLVHQLSWDLAR